jgi:hypothetical protein
MAEIELRRKARVTTALMLFAYLPSAVNDGLRTVRHSPGLPNVGSAAIAGFRCQRPSA